MTNIAARDHNDGVLILSHFAGAAHELHGAFIVNPYDIEQSADAIKAALELPQEQQTHKMKQMRRTIMNHNVYSWAASIFKNDELYTELVNYFPASLLYLPIASIK